MDYQKHEKISPEKKVVMIGRKTGLTYDQMPASRMTIRCHFREGWVCGRQRKQLPYTTRQTIFMTI